MKGFPSGRAHPRLLRFPHLARRASVRALPGCSRARAGASRTPTISGNSRNHDVRRGMKPSQSQQKIPIPGRWEYVRERALTVEAD